jgi:DNA-binding transcriptional LysR family regulator
VLVKGRIKTNNGNAVLSLLVEGAGIAALSDFLVLEEFTAGTQVQLLPDNYISEAGIFAVYQDQRLQQANIRGFIDFLAARF